METITKKRNYNLVNLIYEKSLYINPPFYWFMVDFNSEGAFTSNKAHILELVILGRRDELINAFQLWRESRIENNSKEPNLKNKLRAVLFALFLELERPISRRLKAHYDSIKKTVYSLDVIDDRDLINVFLLINEALDEMNLIKIDNKKKYASTLVENENEEKGI